jgi:hypothetical protein
VYLRVFLEIPAIHMPPSRRKRTADYSSDRQERFSLPITTVPACDTWRLGVIVCLFLLLATVASAWQSPQSEAGAIKGRVVDARTGAGLGKVLISVEDGGPSTVTDDAGAFELTRVTSGVRHLYVSVVGYILVRREVRVVAGAAVDLTIPLSEGTGTYTETVTVTGDRFRETEPGVATQQVLGSADIQNLRGVLADDPLRAVQVLPGVATTDDFRSEFSVRGSDFAHMGFTVDGFSTPYLLHTVRAIEDKSGSGSVAMINSDILDDVTLLNGGYAQRYGDRTGAEVDFRLREGSRERRQARAAVSGTSASLVGEGPLGRGRRGSWLVSARQSYLQLLIERLYKQEQGIDFNFTDAQAKLVYDLSPSQRVELTLLGGRSKLHEQDPDIEAFFTGRNASAIAIGSWRLTTSRGILTARSLTALNRYSNVTTDDVTLDRGHDRQAAARADASVRLAGSLQLDAGAQAERIDQTRMRQRFLSGRYRLIDDFSGDGVRSGGFAALRWTAGPLTLLPGARADHWSLTGETTSSPWLQGEWKVASSLAVRGGAGIYRQFPEFDEVIGALAVPDPRAQRAAQYDLGVEQRLGESMRWQVTVYDREENGFFRRPGSETRLVNGRVVRGSALAVYRQSLEGYARGVELLLQRKSTRGVSGWLSYSFARSHYTDTSSHESYWGDLDQRHTVNVYLFYRMSDRTSVSAKMRAGSNVPAPGYFTERGGDYFVSATRNDLRLPTYSRVDLRGNRTFNWSRKRLTLFAEVMNVLNRDNVRFNPPGVNSSTQRVSGLFEQMIPIVPSAGILIEF